MHHINELGFALALMGFSGFDQISRAQDKLSLQSLQNSRHSFFCKLDLLCYSCLPLLQSTISTMCVKTRQVAPNDAVFRDCLAWRTGLLWLAWPGLSWPSRTVILSLSLSIYLDSFNVFTRHFMGMIGFGLLFCVFWNWMVRLNSYPSQFPYLKRKTRESK